jgi:hypothetical protein
MSVEYWRPPANWYEINPAKAITTTTATIHLILFRFISFSQQQVAPLVFGGHAAVPKEQNTQQSPGFGLSI